MVEVTGHGLQSLALGGGFHTLCDHTQVQGSAKVHDGADNGTIPLIPRDSAYEGLVNLEFVDGKILQVSQAGVAGSKIINGQGHTQRSHLFQPLGRFLRILQQNRFGQLQFQQVWG